MPRRSPFAPPRKRAPRGGGWGPAGRNAAPKPIVIEKPKLSTAELTTAYEWMVVDKIVGFKLAFEWYSNNLTTLLFDDALDQDRQRDYERALKAKNLGDSATIEGERLQAWTTAIRKYEKIWTARNLPKVDAALTATEPSKHITNIQTVLANLNGAFAPIKFRITFHDDREFSEGEILVPQAELNKLIAEPPLKAILAEVPTVAKVVSIVTDEEGNQSLDGMKYMEMLPVVLGSVYAWAAGTTDKLTKPVGKSAAVPSAKMPKTPRSGSTSPKPRMARPILSQIINVVDLSLLVVKGKRQQAINLIVDGMSVYDLKQALIATPGLGTEFLGWVVTAGTDKGAITLS